MSNVAAAPALYRQTFDDEFSSIQSLSTNWTTLLPFWGSTHTLASNHEAEYYVDASQPNSPFDVSNGVLTIQATQASATGANALGLPYNSGAMTTYSTFSQLYGYFEVRAELPAGAGLWPAFWLMPTSFKAGTELDVFEVLGDRPDILYATVHSADPQAALEQVVPVADTSAAFHTYGVDWGPQTTVFYVDGTAVASMATPADMNVPMYMLLNLAVGGASSWPGAPTAQTQFPADFRIDDVRAYQTASTIGWTDPAPTSPAPLVLPAIEASAPGGSAFAYVFVEHYGNQDAGTPLGGIGVALLNAAGQVIATGVTDASGFHTFSNLAAGDYRVQYIMPGAYSVRPGSFADASSGLTSSFNLAAGQGYGVPYQLVTSSAELAGTVQLDGRTIAGVTVTLLNVATGATSTAQTDATGRFSFWTAAGSYSVDYTAPSGTALAPGSLADVSSGLTVPIVLADGQTFLLVPEQLVSSSLAVSAGVAPSSAASPDTISAGDGAAVYRFFDTTNGTQFLTTSTVERDTVIQTRPDLVSEGVGMGAATFSDSPNTVPVYRFFDTRNGTHFYTSSGSERDALIAQRPDLTFEGAPFYEHQSAVSGDAAVYRFFDSVNGTHFYTSSDAERSAVIATRPDLIPEGVAFYAPPHS